MNTLFEEYETFRNQFKDVDYTSLSIGSELPDGSVVVNKTDNELLIASPLSTQKDLTWYDKEQVLNDLVGPWFIPSVDELLLAWNNLYNLADDWSILDKYFSCDFYWSSVEANATGARYVYFGSGDQYTGSNTDSKTLRLCVRAFRRVYL